MLTKAITYWIKNENLPFVWFPWILTEVMRLAGWEWILLSAGAGGKTGIVTIQKTLARISRNILRRIGGTCPWPRKNIWTTTVQEQLAQ